MKAFNEEHAAEVASQAAEHERLAKQARAERIARANQAQAAGSTSAEHRMASFSVETAVTHQRDAHVRTCAGAA